ncbi:ninein isoform X4 [Hyperolius riggenbachi]|uniref:ninein isoform X4 n=1 Tax=Hyperolius riggenbachi TaxID=752182 RepID=UPI0035A2A831
MEQDQYEARLKELFDSFDTTGTGSLGQEELTDLCHMLQLEEVAPSLQQALLQDNPHGRVHFDQFKEALIDVLSSSVFNKENCPEPDGSPEAQPKYIKDGKRYGRRSMPELQDSLEEFDEETVIEAEDEGTRSSQVSSRNCEELWRNEGEEYEAEGQLRFWNPDDLNASQSTLSPEQDWVEEKLQLICEDLGITRDGHLNRKKLLSICEQYGFQNLDKEALEDVLQNLDHDDTVSLQDFFYEVCKNTKPPTPSSSTPYRQLKRHLSLQPYDESGRRTLTPSAMSGTIGLRLFSKFDDGTGYGSVEDIIDLWHEEGIVNGQAILKALDFSLEGKISLTELAMTLENELLITKNEIYQAALISFRSEIRHLLERADQAAREKDKLRSDLDKNEKLKSLMASEVDDHHADIERRNEYNLRKLDEEYKERTAALRSELRKEREQLLQQAGRHRLELEQELDKVRMEENYLRDRLTLCIKENTRMENELLETTEKLVDCETLTSKLQRSLDNILREKFGDLDPSCAEFFRQEERLLQVRNEYERQRRELQDRIDELQLELEDYRSQGLRRIHSPLKSSLFEEMDNNNAVDYDQGIGTEDCPPLNMSIEAEMAIEHMREQHQREVEHLTLELESKTVHYEDNLKEAKHVFEKEQEALKEKLNAEVHKAEEQIRVFKMRHSELESEMQRLKDDQQRAEHEHQERLATMETEFTLQKQQLVEKEASLQLQLEEARQSYHQEKEELLEKEASLQLQLEKARQTYHQEKEELVEKEASLQLQLEKARQTYHQEKEELVEKEASLQLQLEEARQTYHQEKEDLVQRAEDIEKEAEARLVELVTTYEEKRNQLEQSFQEQILSFQEKHEREKEDLRKELSEHLQQEAHEERSENKALIEERTALTAQVTDLKEESENLNQKISELLDACEELWRNLESIQNEKVALEKTVTEMRSRNEQLMSENDVLFRKNSKNQEDLQDLNHRLMAFLKQKDRKDPAKGSEEWQKERGHLREELEGCRSKIFDYEEELSQVKVHHRFLEQENILLRQEMETKQLAKCSEITDLKNEMSHLLDKSEKLMREKETLEEELSSCVAKSAKVSYLEKKLSGLKQEQKTWEQQSNSLRSQLTQSQEKVQNLDESLQGVNLQLSRIKSDLRVAQQEKEALKQEVMSLHKQLQNSNTKKQVLERALQSSGLQNQHKKQYWDDLEQLMGQEQHLLRQENERLQRELINAKTDLTQTREKVRQLESTVISLKHQKQMNQSSLVKALEQEKSSLRRECDQLQLELTSANRKISQLSGLEREVETLKTENDGLRTKQGKYDDHLKEMLHSPTSQSHSHSQLQQPATVPRDHYQQLQQQATVPRDHYLQLQHQLQQAERRNQQLQAAMDNTPQSNEEQLLRKMEARMVDVEQKLRLVKMLLQEKVNQLKDQVTRNSLADAKIKDLFVENSQLLKALELSEQRQQTAEKKNYLLEEKISGLSKIVRDLTPGALGPGPSGGRR